MLAFMHGEYDVLVATTIIEKMGWISHWPTPSLSAAPTGTGSPSCINCAGGLAVPTVDAYSYLLIPAGARADRARAPASGGAQGVLRPWRERVRRSPRSISSCAGPEICWAGSRAAISRPWALKMYTSMLEHAVNELKGEEHPERPVTQLNLGGINLRIDEGTYIAEENQRLRIYQENCRRPGRRRPPRGARGDGRPLRPTTRQRYPSPQEAAALRLRCCAAWRLSGGS